MKLRSNPNGRDLNENGEIGAENQHQGLSRAAVRERRADNGTFHPCSIGG